MKNTIAHNNESENNGNNFRKQCKNGKVVFNNCLIFNIFGGVLLLKAGTN